MGDDQLERLAREGQARQGAQEKAVKGQLSRLEKKQTGEDLLEEALGGSFGGLFWALFVVVVPALFITVGVIAQLNVALVHIGWMVVLFGGGALFMWVGNRWHRAAQRAWVARVPYRFDAERYLALLRSRRGLKNINVKVSFESVVPREARDKIVAAVVGTVSARGWMGDGTPPSAKFVGDVLEIDSGGLHGRFGTTSDDPQRPAHHSNRQFHRWFRLLVDVGLAAVHSRHPIASVAVAF